MVAAVLETVLETLEVRLHAFAVLRIRRGYRLLIDPMDAVVIHYVLAGSGVLRVGNGAPTTFAPRSIMIVPPRLPQSLASPNNEVQDVAAADVATLLADGLLEFTAGLGDGDILTVCGTISATYRGAFGLFDHLTAPLVECVAEVARLRSAFDTLLAEMANPGIGTRALTEALMKQCLIFLLRQHLAERGAASPLFAVLRDHRLSRAVAAVIGRPGARHSRDELAQIAGMSPSSFSQHFSETFGQTPIEFVLRARLHHAAHLLATTDLPIKVVAASIGYASRSHFSRAFRDAYETDPKTYRSLKAVSGDPAPPDALRPSEGDATI